MALLRLSMEDLGSFLKSPRNRVQFLIHVIARLAAALFGLLMAVASPAWVAEVPFNSDWEFHRIDNGTVPDEPPAEASWSMVSLPHTTCIEPRVVNDQCEVAPGG